MLFRTIWRFPPFELNMRVGRLFKHNEVIKLTPKAFNILCCLLSRRGEILEKKYLQSLIWQNRVDPSGLKIKINEIRTALDDDPGNPRFIETVNGQGYRFIMEAEESYTSDNGTRPTPCLALLGKWELQTKFKNRCYTEWIEIDRQQSNYVEGKLLIPCVKSDEIRAYEFFGRINEHNNLTYQYYSNSSLGSGSGILIIGKEAKTFRGNSVNLEDVNDVPTIAIFEGKRLR